MLQSLRLNTTRERLAAAEAAYLCATGGTAEAVPFHSRAGTDLIRGSLACTGEGARAYI
jgi:hypothetical protein